MSAVERLELAELLLAVAMLHLETARAPLDHRSDYEEQFKSQHAWYKARVKLAAASDAFLAAQPVPGEPGKG